MTVYEYFYLTLKISKDKDFFNPKKILTLKNFHPKTISILKILMLKNHLLKNPLTLKKFLTIKKFLTLKKFLTVEKFLTLKKFSTLNNF